MEIGGVVIKAEDDSVPQSHEQSVMVKERCSDLQAAEFKLESELMLSDCEEELYSEDIILGHSSPNLTEKSTASVAPEKTLKIVLKRCDDARQKRQSNSEKSVPEEMSVIGLDTLVVSVKVENEFEFAERVKSVCISGTDNLIEATGGNYKQSDYCLQASALIKIKEEECPVIGELVGHLPSKIEFDEKPLLRIVKLEESKLQLKFARQSTAGSTNEVPRTFPKAPQPQTEVLSKVHQSENECLLSTSKIHSAGENDTIRVVNEPLGDSLIPFTCVKMEKEEEGDTIRAAVGDLLDTSAQGSTCDEANSVSPAVDEHLGNRSKLNSNVQIKEEKAHITEELASSLAGSSTQREDDEKPVLKIIKRVESENCLRSESQSIFDSTIGPAKVHNGVTSSKFLQPKEKVLSEVDPKSTIGVKLLSCSKCNYRCRYQSELTKHLRVHNGERPFECKNCSASFKVKSNLVRHLSTHSDVKGFLCSVCPAKFKRNADLKRLSTKHTIERRFECAHCDRRFKTKDDLRSHLRMHFNEKLHSCPHCPSTFILKDYLKKHLTRHSSEKLYTCEHCSSKFKQKTHLRSHMMIHSNEKPYSCPQCSMAFRQKGNLKTHLRLHTGEKPYSCLKCPAKFRHHTGLAYHLVTHSGEKPFICDQCHKNFKTNSCLKSHKKTHVSKKLHHCAHCSFRSNTQEYLRRHIKCVHVDTEKQHECRQCSYRTYSLSHLKQHFLVHSDVKPFSCDQCHAKFKTPNNLKRHGLVHSTEKTSICDKCSANFKCKSDLQKHLRKHFVKNEFACTKCPLMFLSLRSLKMHSSVHTGERKYVCEYCLANFANKNNIRTHILQLHMAEKLINACTAEADLR